MAGAKRGAGRAAAAGAMVCAALGAALCAGFPGAASAAGEAGTGPVTGFQLPRYVSVKADEANVRRGPSNDHRIDWVFVRKGVPLRVVGEHGPWRRVQDVDDVTGWVHSILLSGTRTAIVTAPEKSALLARPELGAEARAELLTGVIVHLEECRAVWCLAEVEGHEGWIAKGDLWGVDANEMFD
ncbi:SH3 domain-containing protein [Rhodovulum sp. DZ06]|uniref:SH3 domain-containing protein n=1 Tax=Rhodovulum sp. DZ06 TaxID=3425126 RepID=UPI003D33EA96